MGILEFIVACAFLAGIAVGWLLHKLCHRCPLPKVAIKNHGGKKDEKIDLSDSTVPEVIWVTKTGQHFHVRQTCGQQACNKVTALTLCGHCKKAASKDPYKKDR